MAEPRAFIVFCEDTRDEAGNKVSLMGLLGPVVNLVDGVSGLRDLVVVFLLEVPDGRDLDVIVTVKAEVDGGPAAAPFKSKIPAHSNAQDGDPYRAQLILRMPNANLKAGTIVSARIDAQGVNVESQLTIRAQAQPTASIQ